MDGEGEAGWLGGPEPCLTEGAPDHPDAPDLIVSIFLSSVPLHTLRNFLSKFSQEQKSPGIVEALECSGDGSDMASRPSYSWR